MPFSGELSLYVTAALGAIATYGLTTLVVGALTRASRRWRVRSRADAFAERPLALEPASALENRLGRWVRNRSAGARLARIFDEAQLQTSFGQFLLRGALGVLAAVLLTLLATGSLFLTLIIGALSAALMLFWLRWRSSKRIATLRDQLPDALLTASNAMSAGMSLELALEQAAAECAAPIGPELRRVVEDLRIGYALEEALARFRQRAPLEELDAISASILIQRRSGGNLAELFAGTADLLQRDIKLRRELGVLTAQARLSAQVVGLMPFALFALLAVINPGSIRLLISHPLGYVLLGMALVLEVLGFAAIRRIADIKF